VGAEIKGRYLGSALGFLWALIHPLVLILLYVFVFSVVLKVKVGRDGDAVEYGIFLFAGFIPWRMIQDVLVRAPGAYIEKASLLVKIPMPPVVVPASLVLVCLFNLVIDLLVFAAVLLALGRTPSLGILWLLPLVGVFFLGVFGVSLVVADLNVRFRDTAHVCQVVSVLWFLASPIIYPAEMVPESLRWVIDGNPVFGVVGLFRHALLGLPPPPSASIWLSAACVLMGLALGCYWYMRTSRTLVDHL